MNWDNGGDGGGGGLRPMEAVKALRARGVDKAEALLELATPEEILRACQKFDRREGVGPGALYNWIRNGEFDDPAPAAAKTKSAIMRERFDEYARRYPEGAVAEAHATLIMRRWPDEVDDGVCAGDMIVVSASYPVLEMECDACGFVAALTPRALHVLTRPPTLLDDDA